MSNNQPESKWVDIGFKVLSTLAIPILVVGINLYTEVTVQKEKISQLQQRLTDTDAQIVTVNNRLNQSLSLLQETNGELREIRAVMGIIRDRVETQRSQPQRGATR